MPNFDHVEDAPPLFQVTNDETAQWAFRKYNHYRSRCNQHSDAAATEVARIEQWLDEVNKPLLRDLDYFAGLLSDWAKRQRSRDIKTVRLPAGDLKTRPKRGRVEYEDTEELRAWLGANVPAALVTTVAVSRSTLGKMSRTDAGALVTEDGELVPGVTVEPDSVSVSIVPNEGKEFE